MEENTNKRSAYSSGARDGAVMGLAFIFLFVISAYGMMYGSGFLLMLSLLGMSVGVCALLFYFMRRRYVANGCGEHFSAVWAHGSTTMICGNLILGLFIYVFARYIQPGFIQSIFDQMQASIDFYRQSGGQASAALADSMEQTLANYPQPTPISFALSTIYSGSFWGIVASLVLGLLMVALCKKNNKSK